MSIYEQILSKTSDVEQTTVAVQAGAQANGLSDRSSFVKTKFFNSQEVQGNALAQSSLSPKDMWLKYVEIQPLVTFKKLKDEVISAIKHVSGIQYTAKHASLLAYFIDNKRHPVDIATWKSMVDVCIQSPECIANQKSESCTVVCAHYSSRSNYSTDGFVTVGIKTSESLFHTAVACKNLPALEHLLQLAAQQDVGSGLLKPTERIQYYKLKNTTMENNKIINMGGPKFSGAQKFTTEYPTPPTAEASEAAARPTLKRQKTFAAEIKDGTELPDVPKWSDIECEWEAYTPPGDLIDCSPLELAFQQGNWEAWELLTANAVVQAQTTELRLVGKLDRPLPPSLSRLTNLTSLTLKLQIDTATPVPAVVLELLQLRTLNLANCNFNDLPEIIAQLEHLEVLNVANLPLKTLPVLQLGKLKKLTSVDCSGIKLASPPVEIVQHGPEAVARYIRDLGEGAARNHDVLLMFIGDGEAGKTSTLKALKNIDSNVSGTINVDDRTIGIDISSFQPDPARPLKFFAWDFGGQGIYAIMQQLFVSRRALYPLLWRVRQSLDVSHLDPSVKCDVCRKCLVTNGSDKQQPVYRVKGQGLCHAACVSYEPLITSWTERLQFRVPGVPIVLIATHIDCATPEEVDEQCAAVAEVVQRLQARQVQTSADIPPLRIHNDGRSLRVNNMNGEGVVELRQELCQIAESLDFYGEVIPTSYVRLREKLRSMQLRDEASWRTWLHWDVYATLGAECGLTEDSTLAVATRFFHDVGELRYFGLKTQEKMEEDTEPAKQYDSDGDTIEPMPLKRVGRKKYDSDDEAEENVEADEPVVKDASAGQDTAELLAATVFPNPFWVVDVLRGLIRHDHGPLLEQVKHIAPHSKREQKALRRRVYRLMQRGILHETLLPFVWQGVAGLSGDAEINQDEYKRLIALMKAFDILMDKPDEQSKEVEWVVPALMAGKHAHTMEGNSFVDDSLPYVCRVVYDALPPYFDMILIAHVMNARIADSVDFIKGAAAFKKLAERALLFAGQGKVRDPCSVFRSDQAASHPMHTVLRPDQCHVVIAASSRQIMVELLNEVTNLEKFFPGLCRLCTLFPCYSCRMEKQAYCQTTSNAVEDSRTILANAETESQALLKDLEPFSSATSLTCAAFYVKNKKQLVQAVRENPDIKALFDAEIEEQEFELTFSVLSKLRKYYSSPEDKQHPTRFHQEVLKFMNEVVASTDPFAEAPPDSEPHKHIAVCQQAVAERQFQIAFLQAGAELPTLRSINKFCARHVDVLFTAWELCPELEVLCMGLNSALQEEKLNAPSLGINVAVDRLSRTDAAPEYMHLLRSTVEIMTSARPQTPLKSQVAWLETYKEMLNTRRDDITLLGVQHPELRFVQDSAGNGAEKVLFLAEAYGVGTTAYQQEHYALLTAVLQELDTASAAKATDKELTEAFQRYFAFVEAHRSCLSSLPTEQLLIDRRSVLSQFLIEQWDCPGGGPLLDNVRRNDSLLDFGALEWHVRTEQMEKAVTDTLHAHMAEVVAQITELDSTFVRANFATMKEAALHYFHANARYLHVVKHVFMHFMDASDGSFISTWRKLFEINSNGNNDGDESELRPSVSFVELIAEVECAEKVLCFAQLVRKVDSYLCENADAQKLFEAEFTDSRLRTDPLNVREYLQMHAEMLVTAKALESELVCHFEIAGEGFLRSFLCVDSNPAEMVKFPSPAAALAYMVHVITTVVSTADGLEDYAHLAAKMHAWEKENPITVQYDTRDPYNLEILNDSEHAWGLAISTLAHNLELGMKLVDHTERLKELDEDLLGKEIYRTLSYLTEGKDLSVLSELVENRLDELAHKKQMLQTVASLPWEFQPAHETNGLRQLLDDIAEHVGSGLFDDRQQALENVMKSLQDAIKKVVEEANSRLSDLLYLLRWKECVIEMTAENVSMHVEAAVVRAQTHKDHALLSLAQLREEGRLEPALKELVKQSKRGVKTYGDLSESERALLTHRIATVVNDAHQRGARYDSLQQIRLNHGPAWYFGGAPSKNYTINKFESNYELDQWNESLYSFTNSGLSEVTLRCPASFGVSVHSNAQPKVFDEVIILCTTESLDYAELLCRAGNYKYICAGSGYDQLERESLAVWVQVQKEHIQDKFPGVNLPDFVFGMQCDNTFTTDVDGVLVSCKTVLEPGTYTRHPHSALVEKLRCNYETAVLAKGSFRVVEGIVYKSQFNPNQERFVYVQLHGDDGCQYFKEEQVLVKPDNGINHANEWKAALPFNFGGTVRIEVSPGEVKVGVIHPPPIEVHGYDGSALGEFSCDHITLYSAIQLENTKVVICLVDRSAEHNVQFQEDLQRAHDLGLGIIPVICSSYNITDYQCWWPKTLPSLCYHSLFVDMRSCGSASLLEFFKNYIQPTLRVMLNEFKPRVRKLPTFGTKQSPTLLMRADTAIAQTPAVQPTEVVSPQAHSGSQYVFCEQCAADGFSGVKQRRGASKEDAILAAGAFDRWRCQELVGEWTLQELRRREEHPDQPAVFACPSAICCSGEVPHERLVRDVLSVQEKKTSYACPSCVSRGILPPHCFDRDTCLAELEQNQSASILCPRCGEFIPQYDLLACEVFLSYCWGAPECPMCAENASVWDHKRLQHGKCKLCHQNWSGGDCRYTTQRLVTEVKHSIHEEAGVMCWQDVDRLVGGKDLEREMEVGVQKADVIVIFLDDGYVRSANCRKEYLYSTKHGKYIVPVLLQGYSGGTKGISADESAQWWPESMASLSQFEPIILKEASQMEHALQVICERIQSRFHRAQRYATADDAVAYLRDYSSWGATRRAFLSEKLSLDKQAEVDAFVEKTFQSLDRDGNNSVDEAELALFLDSHNLTMSKEQIAMLMMEADLDSNGVLNMEELKMVIYAMLDERDRHNAVD